MELSEDDHTHCGLCIRRNCHEGCAMTSCDQFCGAVFHRCKQSEHELLCPLLRVPCINKENGCPHIMPRHRRGVHLTTCPASVICCTNEWNRRPVADKQNCISSHLLASDQLKTEELDVALMLRDQRFLNMALEQNNNKQLSVVSLATPYCSNQVIRHSDIISLSKQFISSVPPPGLQSSICEQLFGISSENQNGSEICYNDRSGAKDQLPSHSSVTGFNQHCCNSMAANVDGSGEGVSSLEDHLPVCPRLNAVAEENSANLLTPVSPASEMHLSDVKQSSELSHDIQNSITQTRSTVKDHYCAIPATSSPPVLCLDLTIDSLTRYQPKQDSIFTFMCAQVFRRDQYAAHVKNIHSEIYAGLNGWLVQRCPLACYGCPFSVRRMYPNNEHSKVVYSTVVESFGIQPSTDESIYQQENCDPKDKRLPFLVELPTEVLEHIARFLDGFSLNNLALTCRLLRDICYNILPDKGIVVEDWQRIQIGKRKHWYPARYVWLFTNSTTSVDSWGLHQEVFKITEHLTTCKFNDRLKRDTPYRIITADEYEIIQPDSTQNVAF